MNGNHAVAEPLPPRVETLRPPTSRSLLRWRKPGLIALVVVLGLGGVAVAGYHYQDKVKSFFAPPPPEKSPQPDPPVSVGEESGVVVVSPDSPLEKRLKSANAESETVETPVLTVAGSVTARLGSGSDSAESRWDFATAEIASAYGDWIKARGDVAFAKDQAGKVKQLAEANVAYLTEHVNRLEKLVGIGTEAGRDLAAARSDKLKAEIQGQKDVHEGENAVKVAERNRGLLERQLLSAGIDPEVVRKGEEGMVLVVADVPESKVGLVHPGQKCRAKFFSYPDEPLEGTVGRIGPSVSKERRTLRVTFELRDPKRRLLPGMFADVGLGTERREVVTVAVDAVLHVGVQDYVLIDQGGGKYYAREVTVEEALPEAAKDPHATPGAVPAVHVVVRSGLQPGEKVVAEGAILLKPLLVKSLGKAANQ
jgi:cobalt-zinc-cadmium efflux system membrane fusion protein